MGTNLEDPIYDLTRLGEVARYDLWRPDVRRELDRVAAQAAGALGQSIGLVTVVLGDAQCFVGRHGLDGWLAEVGGTPLEWSFCSEVVRSGVPHLIGDAVEEPLAWANPLVGVEGVRCYAGAPLVTASGLVLGSCCVMGDEPTEFSPDDIRELESLARHAVAVLAAYRSGN